MKKIPTAFRRVFDGHKIATVLPEFTSDECKNAVENGLPTIKIDGSCCAIIDGVFYKRYDAKKGKPVPEGAIKCQEEADEVTGHLPCWVKVDAESKSDKWFIAAYDHRASEIEEIYHENSKAHLVDGTYEAIGKHFNGNPYNLDFDTIEPHGKRFIYCDVNSFEAAKIWLEKHPEHEGIVWWYDGKPVCKLKRSDFGLKFPVKEVQR